LQGAADQPLVLVRTVDVGGVQEVRADVDVRIIEDEAVVSTQLGRLETLKSRRDTMAVSESLEALTRAAWDGEANLLNLAVECMRRRATVGEVSSALEEVFGRHRATSHLAAGVYGGAMSHQDEWSALRKRVEGFRERTGRRPRILVAKIGMDGHDRGAKVVASGFADAGFDVELGPLFQSPAEVAQAAVDGDVHIVGISTHAGGHRLLVTDLFAELKTRGGDEILVVCGGIIPKSDHSALMESGVAAVFEPGETLVRAADGVLELLESKVAG
jgi:methylmalonyl-CoA mutase